MTDTEMFFSYPSTGGWMIFKKAALALTASGASLREHLVGSWWYDDYNPAGPCSFVTFSPDGRYSAQSTNSPSAKRHDAYWRAEDGILEITQTKDALPQNNFEIYILDRMTDAEMVFGHPSVAGRMTFRK